MQIDFFLLLLLQQSKALVSIHLPLRLVESEVALLKTSTAFLLDRTKNHPIPVFPKNSSHQNTTKDVRTSQGLQALVGGRKGETGAKVEPGFNFIWIDSSVPN